MRRGFTLVELLIGLAIVAILLNFAIAGYDAMVQAARSNAARSALFATLVQARSTAMLSGADVGLCPSVDGRSCADTDEWHLGWLSYVDANDSDRLDPGDPVLTRQVAAGDGVRLRTSSGRRLLEVQPNGGNAGSNATFTFCDRRGPDKATAIAMANGGTYREVRPSKAGIARACAAS